MMCGGTCEVKEADEKIQKICDEVKGKAEEIGKRTFAGFTAKSYTTQCVAGTNYFIKVHVGEEEYVHLRVFEPLPCHNAPIELSDIQHPKTHSDAIGYF